ncbi:hypothetical protein [Pseudoxanthomonas sp. Soil82]|uniref:hypothetical protein n=1 Tax=Pseudoxanthomonas sp. Soil82 TaxID=3157341 RepID=UPI00338D7447
MIGLFVFALVSAYGRQYARYFSASLGFLFCVLAAAALIFAVSRRSILARRSEISDVERQAKSSKIAFFLSVVGAYMLYCIGAIFTGVSGQRTEQTAIVVSTYDARRCSTKATVRLNDGRTVDYCAGVHLRRGETVRIRLQSSPFGLYARRG